MLNEGDTATNDYNYHINNHDNNKNDNKNWNNNGNNSLCGRYDECEVESDMNDNPLKNFLPERGEKK